MAIQFNCPSCEAMIRVPDNAGGKKGTCPRCNEKLLVPDLATSAGATLPQPDLVPPSQPEPHRLGLPPLDFQPGNSAAAGVPSAKVSLPTPGLPAFDAPAPVASSGFGLPPLTETSTSVSRGRNRKPGGKKTSVVAWIVPIVCILGVGAFLFWFTQKSQPKMEGELTAHAVHDLEVTPGIIPGDVSGLSADDLKDVLKRLQDDPSHWNSASSKIALTGTAKGVEVTLRPGTANHFVSVQPAKNPAFTEFVTKHLAELDQPRRASIAKHAPKLFADWKAQFAKNDPLSDPKLYRDLVALPTLMTGIGYHLEAISNGHVYPCVYEDSQGSVYFLLPNATKSFTLHGRRVAGSLLIPANFHVKLGSPIEAPATRKKQPVAKEKEVIEEKAEQYPDNEGLDPNLYKQDLEEKRKSRKKRRPSQTVSEQKSSTETSEMMMDGEDLMNDEMPAKSKPKKGTMESDDAMMEPAEKMDGAIPSVPKSRKRISTVD